MNIAGVGAVRRVTPIGGVRSKPPEARPEWPRCTKCKLQKLTVNAAGLCQACVENWDNRKPSK